MHNTLNYCGRHLLLEIWTYKMESWLLDVQYISNAMKKAATVSGATILGDNWHTFGPGCGVTGVITLSESHMSIHTWPEYGYAAIDVFMCGECDPQVACNFLKTQFKNNKTNEQMIVRGMF